MELIINVYDVKSYSKTQLSDLLKQLDAAAKRGEEYVLYHANGSVSKVTLETILQLVELEYYMR